ncbi:MAG: tRNA (adenosine(37)-N6)-threonylcarbamoyltransferase complex dimerization subunit type 1 TsaB [Oleiphilaceae bacterium]|nr:tRNA (adenosine(37)-N6)-threonylcarbamoyltransferase complex dimerization subunit type 1 TsaB [Oleiphilaceae bacterium]
MNLLALDTSSEGCSAALLQNGRLTDRFTLAPRGHTRLLMPMVRELLAEQGLAVSALDAVAFARGPGSFTGLRIATGVVQGLAYGLGIAVVPVSSLAAVAARVARESPAVTTDTGIAVAFDARMGEVYWGCYRLNDGRPEPLAPERVCAPGSVTLPNGAHQWLGAGSGWTLQADMPIAVTSRVAHPDTSCVPRAREVAILGELAWQRGETVPAFEAMPVYLRDEVTWQKLPGR